MKRNSGWLVIILSTIAACSDPAVNNPTPDAGNPIDVQVPADMGTTTTDQPRVTDNGVRADVRPDSGTASRTAVVAGRACMSDETCTSETADLVCTALPGGRICSGAEFCEQGNVAAEEAACGGRFSTCLVVGNFTNGTQASACTRACVPAANTEALGQCPAGSICTNNWLQLMTGQTEAAGCLPFCTEDSQCAGLTAGDASLMRCNVRTGRCASAPVNMALLPDGSACNPMLAQSSGVNPCRGICFAVTTGRPTEGLCGSFINLRAAADGCPDGASFQPRGPGDNLSVCIFKDCDNNTQCEGDLRCVFPENAMGIIAGQPASCGYRTTLQPNGIPLAGADGGVPSDAGIPTD